MLPNRIFGFLWLLMVLAGGQQRVAAGLVDGQHGAGRKLLTGFFTSRSTPAPASSAPLNKVILLDKNGNVKSTFTTPDVAIAIADARAEAAAAVAAQQQAIPPPGPVIALGVTAEQLGLSAPSTVTTDRTMDNAKKNVTIELNRTYQDLFSGLTSSASGLFGALLGPIGTTLTGLSGALGGGGSG